MEYIGIGIAVAVIITAGIIIYSILKELLNNSPPNLPNIQSCIK